MQTNHLCSLYLSSSLHFLSPCLHIANIQLGLQSKAQRVFPAKENWAFIADSGYSRRLANKESVLFPNTYVLAEDGPSMSFGPNELSSKR